MVAWRALAMDHVQDMQEATDKLEHPDNMDLVTLMLFVVGALCIVVSYQVVRYL